MANSTVGPVYCCPECWSHIQSKNRHHMDWCECGNCAIDGGADYVKVSFKISDPRPVDEHDQHCGVWTEEPCSCARRYDDYDEPPERISKSAKPKHGVSGRSVFTIVGAQIKRWKGE